MMRKLVFTTFLFLCTSLLWAEKDYHVYFEQPRPDSYQLSFTIDDWRLNNVTLDGTDYTQINFSSSTFTQDEGYAELPFISASVQLPGQKNVDFRIISSEYKEVTLAHPLVPSRGVIYRNQDPSTIPFRIAAESIVDQFYPDKQAHMETPFIVRDVRGTSVRVYPFAWNAVTKTLRIYTNLKIELLENDTAPINPLLKNNPVPVKEAIGMYESIFINYNRPKLALGMAEYGDLLVITTARDEAVIEPYITWKREKGINVSKVVVERLTNVKNLIKQQYDENNQLMYVLLVGDWSDIRSQNESFGSAGSGPTDPMLGCVVGDDIFPDIAIGRFSSNKIEHVTTQVNKTIGYEKDPYIESDWMESFIGIGSNELLLGDDGEKDFEHIQRIYNQRLKSFTYTKHLECYAPLASASLLTQQINSGASSIAYCGHGMSTYFVTTGFNNDNVLALSNGRKLPFVVAVACYTGAFHNTDTDCFGETWLRKEDGGAVIAWMSSVEQPWRPPQRGQDYFYDVLTGGFNYDLYEDQNGINTSEQRTHWGAVAVNAMGLMLSESRSSDDEMTVKTWITFGDPSLQLRTKTPDVIVSSNNKIVSGTNFETTITANGQAVKDALVCISQNGVYAKALTDMDGRVSIPHSFEPAGALLVVTGFNTTTIYEDVLCISPEGPYLLVDKVEVNDSNKQLDYLDASTKLSMTLKNVGNDAAKNVKVTISTEDPYVTIVNNTATFTAVPANDLALLDDAFEIQVNKNIPDQHRVIFDALIEESDTWNSDFRLTANSFHFAVSNISINGVKDDYLQGNKVAIIRFTLKNEGHMDATAVSTSISSDSPYLNVPVPSFFELGDYAIGKSGTVEITTTVSESIIAGHDAKVILALQTSNGAAQEESFVLSTPDFCVPNKQDCSDGDGFASFILGDIVNTDDTCTDDGYSDYTNLSTDLTPGTEYLVKAKFAYMNERAQAWIDFNNDGTFDKSEAVFTLRGAKAGAEVSQAFTIPEDANPGAHRMRVRVKYQTVPTDPCVESSEKGQTHDYTVVVTETFPRVRKLNAWQQGDKVKLEWDAPEVPEGKTVKYSITKNNEPLTDNLTANTFEDSEVSNGQVYVYQLFSVYEDGTSLPALSNIVVVNSLEIPSALMAQVIGETTISLSWKSTAGALGYNLYRDGKRVNAELITALSYADTGLEKETVYDYAVTAVYESGESGLSKKVSVSISGLAIDEVEGSERFEVYPNPVTDLLNIRSEWTLTQVTVMDMQGRTLKTIQPGTETVAIPTLDWTPGLYLIRIQTNESVSSYKVVKR